jgi:hypothetical protein
VPIAQPGEQSADRRLCEGFNSVNWMLQAGDYSAASYPLDRRAADLRDFRCTKPLRLHS